MTSFLLCIFTSYSCFLLRGKWKTSFFKASSCRHLTSLLQKYIEWCKLNLTSWHFESDLYSAVEEWPLILCMDVPSHVSLWGRCHVLSSFFTVSNGAAHEPCSFLCVTNLNQTGLHAMTTNTDLWKFRCRHLCCSGSCCAGCHYERHAVNNETSKPKPLGRAEFTASSLWFLLWIYIVFTLISSL